jgi:Protein of unknown function (DUF2490)
MALVAALVLSPCVVNAQSGDPLEFWGELNLFKKVNPTTRLYFVVADTKGKESEFRTIDLAGFVDLTLGPQLPRRRQKQDWQTRKYLWVRIGYDHIFKAEDKTRTAQENRGIVALYGRVHLPGAILFEARTRADLRWIDGNYSTRYRFRAEVNRDFTVLDRVVTPYVQAEYFYDTRYDGWARDLYQVGAEIGVTGHFRVEPSVVRQLDHLPSQSGLHAFSFVARWYY